MNALRSALLIVLLAQSVTAGQDPVGTTLPAVGQDLPSVEALALRLKPLRQSEIAVEAEVWLDRLEESARLTCEMEIRISTNAAGASSDSLIAMELDQSRLVERVQVVLDALEQKGGEVAEQRQYLKAVSGVSVDFTDPEQIKVFAIEWVKSPEGGIRWGVNLTLAVVALIAFRILATILTRAARKALSVSKKMSDLLRDFIIKTVHRATMFTGVLVALSMLEVKLGPLLAMIGAAGFVVGFALQGTLSNFASGIMILAYRPFDVGDAISVAGTSGSVESLNLVSTVIKTFDNQRVVIPNNSIWGDVITNVSGMPTRRVDMVFGIGYDDDADKARSILEDILKAHDLVLPDPAPVVKLHELADSSVNFICRPWTRTSDYWAVYWDVTRTAKAKFDAAGISIPFPQRDVHIYQESAQPS
jgi:small conductance mechanosensitive channel